MYLKRWPQALAVLLALAAAAPAQNRPDNKTPRKYSRQPDRANVAYGPHERNVLDFWQAKSERATPLVIHIHGGGFTGGDKTFISPVLLNYCLESGISVASINYRYSTQAPYPAPMADSARAVQFLRLHAKGWNLNPKAFAATGGSAGAGISLWIGFHDDMAAPNSEDPIKRQSTRLSAIGTTNGQSSYDPRFIAKLIGEPTARHPALAMLFGVPGQDVFKAEKAFPLYEDGSAIPHLSAGDPPVFMYYSMPMKPLPPANTNEGIHNPRFGYALKERMDKLGIECVVHLIGDYQSDPAEQSLRQMVDFFSKHFPH